MSFKDNLRNREFETSQGYMARPCLKGEKKGRKEIIAKDLLLLKVLKDIIGTTDKT